MLRISVALLAFAATTLAQTPRFAFEVASVKQNKTAQYPHRDGVRDPCLQYAVRQISGRVGSGENRPLRCRSVHARGRSAARDCRPARPIPASVKCFGIERVERPSQN